MLIVACRMVNKIWPRRAFSCQRFFLVYDLRFTSNYTPLIYRCFLKSIHLISHFFLKNVEGRSFPAGFRMIDFEYLILPPFQNKLFVTFGHKLRYEIKITFGENSLKLRQTNRNVATINVNVVVDELSGQITIYICSTIDIWTQRRQHTSMWFYTLWCHPPKMACFQPNWCQKFLILLWTPLACWKALSETYTMHAVSC